MIWGATMLWGALAVLAAAVAAAMLMTVRARGEGLERDDGALRILRDQLGEVARDEARGLIAGDEARAAEVEIKRRILAISGTGRAAPAARSGRAALIVAALLTPIAGAGLYALTGAPGTESQPFASRTDERQEATEMATLVERLRSRMIEDETGGPTQGWQLLGQSYMQMGRYADAADAFARLVDRDDAGSSTHSQYAEALIAGEGGIVTPTADRALDRALAADPANPRATFYKAQALEQSGALGPARTMLIERLRASRAVEPWMEIYVSGINRIGEQLGQPPATLAALAPALMRPAAPGPSAEDVEAAGQMTDDERNAFIRSMVDRLAARLEDEPGDLEGWMRLAQAYAVLGDAEGAEAARDRAAALARALPEGDPDRAAVLRQLGLSE